MTLTQLNVFVLVARLGSVTAAAGALGVSEPAVSQALAALRQHLGDQLITRGPGGMTLTPGGSRLLGAASQMVALGAEAQAAVREARGAPEQLRVVATSTIAEFVAAPLIEAFTRRLAGKVEVTSGVAASGEMPVLVANRLADMALGPEAAHDTQVVSEPIFRYKIVVVSGSKAGSRGNPHQWIWLVDPSATDPASDVSKLLHTLRVPESRIRVFSNQTAAWAAAAAGSGVAPAAAHLVDHQVRRGDLVIVDLPATPRRACLYATMLPRQHRRPAASALRRFLGTPEAMRLMGSPTEGVPPSRFRPPVYVTIWR